MYVAGPKWTEMSRLYFGRVEVSEESCNAAKSMKIRFGMCGAFW
jgi:hypothetical protein